MPSKYPENYICKTEPVTVKQQAINMCNISYHKTQFDVYSFSIRKIGKQDSHLPLCGQGRMGSKALTLCCEACLDYNEAQVVGEQD